MAELDLNQVIRELAERIQNQDVLIRELRNHRNHDPFKIPDAIKLLPSFDGSKRLLPHWIQTAENTLNKYRPLVTQETMEMYEQAVINKLEGKARDAISNGNPNSFEEAKEILMDTLSDRQEMSTYKYQLWTNKMEGSVHKYYKRHKELMQSIKTLAKQNTLYNENWEAINAFIEEDALAAFISGLQKTLFGFVQAAKPASVEEAHAFICKFQSNESNKKINSSFDSQRKEYRQNKKPENQAEAMEIDHSLRSKLSNNRRINVNAHETNDREEENHSEKEYENDYSDADSDSELTINFWEAPNQNQKT
jgi:hypothetical protein